MIVQHEKDAEKVQATESHRRRNTGTPAPPAPAPTPKPPTLGGAIISIILGTWLVSIWLAFLSYAFYALVITNVIASVATVNPFLFLIATFGIPWAAIFGAF